VLFGHSAALSLTHALRFPGRPFDARVIVLEEAFHLGPIAPADAQLRAAWFRAELLWRRITARQVHRFWKQVVGDELPIVWACSRDSREWSGFMELAWRRRRPFLHVDVAPIRRGGRLWFCSTGEVPSERIVDDRLVECARRVEQTEVDAHVAAWEALARDPAPMRIATPAGLLAVPLSYFDDAILARTPPTTWIRAMHVIGDLLGYGRDLTRFAQFDAGLLAQRIDALLLAGQLESDNIDAELRALRVRRPSRVIAAHAPRQIVAE
jgi:Protein of unknown function/Domain of unknown function (DUF1835)